MPVNGYRAFLKIRKSRFKWVLSLRKCSFLIDRMSLYIKRGEILPENRKWSAKNEFCVFEHQTFLIDNLNHPNSNEKQKTVLDIKFENFSPCGYLKKYHFLPYDGRPTSEKKWEWPRWAQMKDNCILNVLTLSRHHRRHHQTISTSSFCPQHLAGCRSVVDLCCFWIETVSYFRWTYIMSRWTYISLFYYVIA